MYLSQPKENKIKYKKMLYILGKLSRLFSENESPYLVSRSVENIFCEALNAENLGRDDSSIDALIKDIGIGIKTFLYGNGKTLQKIAEFNRDAHLYRAKSPREIVRIISTLRNERLDFTLRNYKLKDMIYHLVTRLPGKIQVYEMEMYKIDIRTIKNIKISGNKNIISFADQHNEYNFNLSKSTLSQRFYTKNPILEIDVKISDNPYKDLSKLYNNDTTDFTLRTTEREIANPCVILPLFSDRGSKRNVPERSGLNQWNAAGRPRNVNEIYIPIPSIIHKTFPSFFPDRDVSFDLILPNKNILSAKVCQDNRKALMTNPNKALGEWLLRDVLKVKEGELLTYEYLETLGIDSVIIEKINTKKYKINFSELGTYDEFILETIN